MVEPATQAEQQKQAPHPLVALRGQMQQRLGEFKNALPPQIPPERFERIVMTAVQLNPELLTCNRQTFFNACMRAASDGLLPDGRQAALVPFKDGNTRSPYHGQYVVQYMPMVAGLLTRFRNSGEFKSITTNVVRKGDKFRHWTDENGEHIEHEPADDASGEVIKAYAVAAMKSGGVMVRVMSKVDIDKRRNVSRAKDGPMWREWYDEAAMKTVLRNLAKRLPSSSDDIDRIAREEEDDVDPDAIKQIGQVEQSPQRDKVSSITSALDTFGGADTPAVDDVKDAPHESTSPDQSQPQEDQSSDPPDALKAARDLGAKQRKEGVQRRAVPPQYREQGHEAEADAWREGWDNAG